MKRQTRVIGSVVKIPLKDGTHSYGLILDKASVAVFNVRANSEILIDEIVSQDVLFIVAVYDSAITSGRWVKVGKSTLAEKLKTLPLKFIQDELDSQHFEIYDPNTGRSVKATKEACVGLERAAVWEAEHVEDRVLDHFMHRENKWVKQLQIR